MEATFVLNCEIRAESLKIKLLVDVSSGGLAGRTGFS